MVKYKPRVRVTLAREFSPGSDGQADDEGYVFVWLTA